MMIECENPATV